MARKIPPPPEAPDPQECQEGHRGRQDGGQQTLHDAEQGPPPLLSPLLSPPPSPGTPGSRGGTPGSRGGTPGSRGSTPGTPSSGWSGGARPRTRTASFRRLQGFEEARRIALQNRRRLDSLNLETSASTSAMMVGEPDGAHGVDESFSDLFGRVVGDWMTPMLSGSSYHPNSIRDTQDEGQELYLHFFHEQLRGEGIDESALEEERLNHYHDSTTHLYDESLADSPSRRSRRYSMNLSNFQNPVWRQAGSDLKSLAEQFAHSRERELVRRSAEQVDVASLDMQQFMELLKELFQGGQITRERILVLFFFCSDLAIYSVRCRLNGMLAQLTRWTLMFIRGQVCDWVQRSGGWQTVLRSGMNLVQQAAVIGMCSAVMVACFFYVRKNLLSK